jgi:hypothetical protein
MLVRPQSLPKRPEGHGDHHSIVGNKENGGPPVCVEARHRKPAATASEGQSCARAFGRTYTHSQKISA